MTGGETFAYTFWLVVFSASALFSALLLIGVVYAGNKRASWGWGLSFASSSLTAAYFFGRLL